MWGPRRPRSTPLGAALKRRPQWTDLFRQRLLVPSARRAGAAPEQAPTSVVVCVAFSAACAEQTSQQCSGCRDGRQQHTERAGQFGLGERATHDAIRQVAVAGDMKLMCSPSSSERMRGPPSTRPLRPCRRKTARPRWPRRRRPAPRRGPDGLAVAAQRHET